MVVQASQAEKNQAARLAAQVSRFALDASQCVMSQCQVAGELDLPAKLQVDNLHMDIAEDDLQTL